MKKGKIIILNGTSSVGKSTLARVIQDRVSEAFFVITGDDYMQMLGRSKYVDISNEAFIQYNLVEAYTAKALSDRGMNLIMDTVFWTDEELGLKEWVEMLRDNPVLFVLLTCPLEELRRREKERDNRDMRYDWDGKAESQIATLYPQDIYDITIDNYTNTKEECADKIIELLNCPEKFSAFKNLWLQRSK